jgi:hypothetical protein
MTKRAALDAAARAVRDAQRTDRDELLAAQRVIRRAGRRHDAAVDDARRRLDAARRGRRLAGYRGLTVYETQLHGRRGVHDLEAGTTVRVGARRGRLHRDAVLAVEGPGWKEELAAPERERARLDDVATTIEAAARDADAARGRAREAVAAAERSLGAARADRQGVEQARPLLRRLAELVPPGEALLDMAPAVHAGHDGIVIATEDRVLFVALRDTVSCRYQDVSRVAVKGRWLPARLALGTTGGTVVFAGLAPPRAAELGDLIRARSTTDHQSIGSRGPVPRASSPPPAP